MRKSTDRVAVCLLIIFQVLHYMSKNMARMDVEERITSNLPTYRV
jgi:hypothetical protein